MKTRIYVFLIFCMVAGMMAAQEAQPQKKYTVTNERQFFDALSSNTHIIIPEGLELNLNKFLNNKDACELLGIKPVHQSSGISYIASYENVDGAEAHIVGMQNVTIEGSGKQLSQIVVEPRYAYVLNFIKCSNITLRNLKIGHTEAGHCTGGVLNLVECQDVTIEGCDLYGCGTEGITGSDVHGMKVDRTFIHDCTYSIMTLQNCYDVQFNDCLFARNREFSLVNVHGLDGETSFNNCQFHSNQGPLFYLQSQIAMTNCEIIHSDDLGNIEKINQKNCQWKADFDKTAASAAKQESPIQAAKKVEIKDEPVTYHQWKGKHEGSEYLLVYAQKGDVLMGEVSWKYNSDITIHRVLGAVDKDGDIRMHIYNTLATNEVIRDLIVRIDGKEMELFEPATQKTMKFKRSKEDLRFALDREPQAYCSPFNKEEVRSFLHSPGEMVGIYEYTLLNENGTSGTVNLSLAGEDWSVLQADISTLKKGDQLWITTQTKHTEDKIVLMEKRVEDSDCVLRYEILFYSDFIIVRTLEQSNCWGNKSIDGIYVKLPSVG